ncbi:Hsp20/alpha crystallin family protein [Tropicimonas sp. TH_r6]|uniref:Hsp20/alpha crystallin family protein n=1 Tax=Tropicimonas sp. TH_r6 TaxID=3082085 RepID=UPI002955D5F7|nr:Hsp20/alpha crystallin family protein [Tropicimonas sp. TH_r6]MDV7143155.1 Hsp20/alpha crystallin family protein [Tropicimonas sp. TH_r6]
MTHRTLFPTNWLGRKEPADDPFQALKSQVESLFDSFDVTPVAPPDSFDLRTNVSETDKEIRLTAELPGLTDEDVEVSVVGNRISIQGEKKSEKDETREEDGRQFHRIERSSGAFQRVLALPFEIDPEGVEAEVRDGVLTVSLPKPEEIVEKTRKIPVSHHH